MSLVQELKRRNVFRVAAAYIFTAWLLLQLADVVLNNTTAPDWVFSVIMLVLGLGFPVAVLFAWAFEMTPEGLKKEKDVDRSRSITHNTGRKLDFVIIAVMAVALGYFAWDKFIPKTETSPTGASPTATVPEAVPAKPVAAAVTTRAAPANRSIAVLPFVDMSPEQDQEYLSDGIAEELLNLLVQIPDLSVAARTSSFSFKGKDTKISEVARELNVAHVLEGSVRKAGERVRITAQLIKADDGYHLWSETFDRTLDDVFAIQDEISAAVVTALKIELLGAAPTRQEVNPEAYSLYLQGRYLFERRSRKDWDNAVNTYNAALEIEPDYPRALAGLAAVLEAQAGQGYIDLHEGHALARKIAQKALNLDPNLAEAHAALAWTKMSYDWDWAGAEASFQRAMDLAPGDAAIISQMGVIKRFLGQFDEAIELDRRAIELDPLSLSGFHTLGLAQIYSGQLDEALATYNHLIKMNPDFAAANLARSRVFLLMGKSEEALAAAKLETEPFWREYGILISLYALGRNDEADKLLPAFIENNQFDSAYQIAQVYDFRGDVELAFEWLDRAYVQRDGGLPEMMNDPFLSKLSSDPRWADILRKVGLSEARQKQ
jgi:adenylate cyclase